MNEFWFKNVLKFFKSTKQMLINLNIIVASKRAALT